MRIRRDWQWPRQSLTLYVEIINVTGHDNVGAIEYEVEALASGGFELFSEDKQLLPLVPSIGFIWRFK